MHVQFFGHQIQNPVLKVVVITGAAAFAVALVAVIAVILIPVLGAVLTGVILILAVVLLLLVVFVPLVSFLGVILSPGKRGSGIERTEERPLESFNSVKISGSASAVVVMGDEPSVTVSTDENLLEFVETRVRNGVLHTGFSKRVSAVSPLRLSISAVELRELAVSGAAKVKASGESEELRVRVSGAGRVDASELIARRVTVGVSGAGRVDVHAEDELSVKISGAGRVSCSGSPEKVHRRISGAGKVTVL